MMYWIERVVRVGGGINMEVVGVIQIDFPKGLRDYQPEGCTSERIMGQGKAGFDVPGFIFLAGEEGKKILISPRV